MKKLLLIRHAKAVSENGASDFERPLKYSGLQDAEIMAERLMAHSIIPQVLITSPAIRTETTANIFSEHLSVAKPLEEKRIYEASTQTLLHIINELSDVHNFVGLVGHNPSIGQILYYLTGAVQEVPTCAVALIEFELDEWKMIGENTGQLKWYSTPQN